MRKEKPNKIPRPSTIARHYAEGKYCDYPADIVLSAVNSYDKDYNPTAIPVEIGFKQLFVANFNAFAYLCEHRSEDELKAFLADPDGYMDKAGVALNLPFDEYAPKIFVALMEDEILNALKSEDKSVVCRTVYSEEENCWRLRHTERYPKGYMKRDCFYRLKNIPYDFDESELRAAGFNSRMGVNLLFIADFFAEDLP